MRRAVGALAREGSQMAMTQQTQYDTSRDKKHPCLVLLGATASGKTQLSLELARRRPVEIVSVDSMQVYRGMDIGTAKPAAEERRQIPHHVIDIIEPEESFNVGEFCRVGLRALDGIYARGNSPLLVCGTPLYLKALLWGLLPTPGPDPVLRARLRREAALHGTQSLHSRLAQVDAPAAARISPNDLKRVERALEVHELTGRPISAQQGQFDGPPRIDHVIVGLRWPRAVLYERINTRVDGMMEAGLLQEVRRLDGRLGPQACQAVGYKEFLDHLAGRTTLEEAVRLVKRNSRRLAKHQMAWFKRFPGIRWVDGNPWPDAQGAVRLRERVLERLDRLPALSYD